MGGIVTVVDEFCVGADLAIVALDEPEEAEDAAFVDAAEGKRAGCVGEGFLNVFAEADRSFFEVLWFVVSDLPDDEVDEAHGEHMVGEKGELVFLGLVVCRENVPEEIYVFLFCRSLEGEREVVSEFGGFFHGSVSRRRGFFFIPNAGEGGLDFFLEAGDQFAVGGHQRLLGFDLHNDLLLCGEGRERDFKFFQPHNRQCFISRPENNVIDASGENRVEVMFKKVRI